MNWFAKKPMKDKTLQKHLKNIQNRVRTAKSLISESGEQVKANPKAFETFLQSLPDTAKYTCSECGKQFMMFANFSGRVEVVVTEFPPDTCPDCSQMEVIPHAERNQKSR